MKFSKIVLGTMLAASFTVFATASIAKAKNHDGEIIAYMEAINTSEINVSKVAKDKKIDEDVMKFADMMIDQHSANLKQVTDLSSKIDVAADETPAVKKFEDNEAMDLEKLSKKPDDEFQKAYIKAMIKGHTDVNKMLTKFEKEAQNPDLKQYLSDTKTAVGQHLAAAKELK